MSGRVWRRRESSPSPSPAPLPRSPHPPEGFSSSLSPLFLRVLILPLPRSPFRLPLSPCFRIFSLFFLCSPLPLFPLCCPLLPSLPLSASSERCHLLPFAFVPQARPTTSHQRLRGSCLWSFCHHARWHDLRPKHTYLVLNSLPTAPARLGGWRNQCHPRGRFGGTKSLLTAQPRPSRRSLIAATASDVPGGGWIRLFICLSVYVKGWVMLGIPGCEYFVVVVVVAKALLLRHTQGRRRSCLRAGNWGLLNFTLSCSRHVQFY